MSHESGHVIIEFVNRPIVTGSKVKVKHCLWFLSHLATFLLGAAVS
jgi:hypothetical protein